MRKTSSIVIAIHCALILWMTLFSTQTKPEKKARLIVKTVTPHEKKLLAPRSTPIAAQAPAAESKPVSMPVAAPQAAPSPVPTVSPASPKKVQTPSPKPAPVKPVQSKPRPPIELLKQLEQSLAKLEKAELPPPVPAKKRNAFSVPTLKIDHQLNEEEGDVGYESELIGALYNQLHLPEFGEVKMKLTLQNNGTFVKMQVIRAQSLRNRRYLEEELPKLRMPRFIGALTNKKEETFILTFCNE